MRANPMPFPERSFIGTCIRLAQTTFFDLLPANAEQRAPAAPATMPANKFDAAARPTGQRLITWLDNWFHAQAMRERDAYLAQSQDIFELEDRIRRLQRYPYY